jgi:hypothetical protein
LPKRSNNEIWYFLEQLVELDSLLSCCEGLLIFANLLNALLQFVDDLLDVGDVILPNDSVQAFDGLL